MASASSTLARCIPGRNPKLPRRCALALSPRCTPPPLHPLQVQIRDDDKKPGLFRWHNERIEVLESCGSVNLTVLRTMGLAGEVSTPPQHPTTRRTALPPCPRVFTRVAPPCTSVHPVHTLHPLAPPRPLTR